MEDNDFVLDSMTWSFSRLNSYHQCPHEWYQHYYLGEPSEDGFFSEFGSFMHKILELYAKDKLSLFDLTEYYEENFCDEIPHDAPPNKSVDLKESYYNLGMDYLENIDLDLDSYEVLGVEKKVNFTIAGKKFVGCIDLLLRDKETGAIIIVDHKSSTIKRLKNGNISKQDIQHFLDFKRQLYLYSIPVMEEYGRVDILKWNMFKMRNWIEIPYDKAELDEAVHWAEETLEEIEKDELYLPQPDFYYCHYLCGQRNKGCEFKP